MMLRAVLVSWAQIYPQKVLGFFYPRYCTEVLISITCGVEWMSREMHHAFAPISVVELNF